MNPNNTVFDAKRLIGRRFDDSAVQSDVKHWPFTVINEGGKPKIEVTLKTRSTANFSPFNLLSVSKISIGKRFRVSKYIYMLNIYRLNTVER